MSVEKDPWLQQALRHAPDHNVAVPAAVRDTILHAARAAVRQPQAAQSPWWQRWLAPLMQPARLGYSGAFMALLVVGLWGLDQWDKPTLAPEQGPVLAVPATTAPTTAPASPGPAEATVPAPRPEAPKAAATDALDLKEAAASRRMAVADQAKAQAEEQASARAREATPPSVVAAEQVALSKVAAAEAVAAAKPAPTAAPAVAPAPAAPAPVAATALEAPQAAAAPPAPAPAPAGLAAPRKMMKAGPALDQAAANADQPLNPMAALLTALASNHGLRWQAAQAQGAHGPAQDLWLGRLQQASTGLWRPVAALPEGPPTVQWQGRDGAQLWLQPDGQVWLAWRNQAHVARLPEADAALLRAQLADWH